MPEGHKVVTKTLSMFRDSHKTNTSQSDSLTQLSRVYQVSPIQPAVIAFTQAHITAANSQAFNWVDYPSPTAHFFTYNMFISKLRDHLTTMGIDPQSYAGHSFRRGGASFAYQSGVPLELIKALGDWRSDTILIYLTMPLTIRLRSANMLCKSILSTHTT